MGFGFDILAIFMGDLGRCKNPIINVILPEFVVLPFGVIFKRLIYMTSNICNCHIPMNNHQIHVKGLCLIRY